MASDFCARRVKILQDSGPISKNFNKVWHKKHRQGAFQIVYKPALINLMLIIYRYRPSDENNLA